MFAGAQSCASALGQTLIIARRSQGSYGKMTLMPKKKKAKKFRAVIAVKAIARERIGTPKPSRVAPGVKDKTQKHKPTITELINESD